MMQAESILFLIALALYAIVMALFAVAALGLLAAGVVTKGRNR